MKIKLRRENGKFIVEREGKKNEFHFLLSALQWVNFLLNNKYKL